MKLEFIIKFNCKIIKTFTFKLNDSVELDFDYNWDQSYDYDFILKGDNFMVEFEDCEYRDWSDNDELLLTQVDEIIVPITNINKIIETDNEKYVLLNGINWVVDIQNGAIKKLLVMKIDYEVKYYFPFETNKIEIKMDQIPSELIEKYTNDFFWIFNHNKKLYFASVKINKDTGMAKIFNEHKITIYEDDLNTWNEFIILLNNNKSSIEYRMDQGHNLEMYVNNIYVMYIFDNDYSFIIGNNNTYAFKN